MAEGNLFFHETFQPEITYISKILELAIDEEGGDKFRISEITGIPTGDKKGKVEPHIKYAKYMGLIDYEYNRGQYKLSPTELGKVIWEQDRYLHESLTLWLLHYNITREELGAAAWRYVVKKLNTGFNVDISSEHASSLIQKEFGIASADITKFFSVVKNSYVSGCFSNLYFMEWDEIVSYEEKTEQIEFAYLYAYALFDSWNICFANKNELTLSEIIDNLSFGKVFGLNDEDIDSVLCTLQELGIVSINRQLFPITVVKTAEKDMLLNKMYSLLM